MARTRLDPGRHPAGTSLPEQAPVVPAPRLPTWAAAHDLAGGVRGIVQLCGLIDVHRDRLPADAVLQLDAIGQRARRLQRFIRDLQELERPRNGGSTATPPVADPASVVRAVMAELEPELAALRPRLHLGWLPELAVAPDDLSRLLTNLIVNALQHRAPVKPRIEIGATWRKGMVELTVADNGPGIPAEERARLFEPFVRLPSARRQPGSGLGLAICRAIVEGYGGEIWVEPAPAGGSRFCCTLPPCEP
jgi:signal transduction histidine kinase